MTNANTRKKTPGPAPESTAQPTRRRPKTSAIAAATATAPTPAASIKGKIGIVVELLGRPQGARTEELMAATGWQAHSVRGAIAGTVKKKLGLSVSSEKSDAGRLYRIVEEAVA